MNRNILKFLITCCFILCMTGCKKKEVVHITEDSISPDVYSITNTSNNENKIKVELKNSQPRNSKNYRTTQANTQKSELESAIDDIISNS